jgi:hypothetical protein
VRMAYVVHILAGSLGLVTGYVALYSAKGAPRHRRSGTLFVYAMLTMCVFGASIALVRGVAPALNVPAGVLTAYLVITALTTVRPLGTGATARRLQVGLMIVALAVGLTSLAFGFEALASVDGKGRNGMPAFPFFLFGVVGTLAGLLDVRMIRAGGLRGTPRLVRHLWRMCFALFIAAMSFFIGQAKVFPKPVRILPLLAVPVLLVLGTMIYWLWRVRIRGSVRGIVLGRATRVGVGSA